MSLLYIKNEATNIIELRRRLLELHPQIDEQTLADTLEGATSLREALEALVRSALEDECLAKALRERIETMRVRLARLEARALSKRQVVVEGMSVADMPKIVAPDFTASVRMGPPGVEIVDESELPIDFLVPQAPKPDKRLILEALSRGTVVPGALLAQPKISLAVRSQ
jgi:hypothetical protein